MKLVEYSDDYAFRHACARFKFYLRCACFVNLVINFQLDQLLLLQLPLLLLLPPLLLPLLLLLLPRW